MERLDENKEYEFALTEWHPEKHALKISLKGVLTFDGDLGLLTMEFPTGHEFHQHFRIYVNLANGDLLVEAVAGDDRSEVSLWKQRVEMFDPKKQLAEAYEQMKEKYGHQQKGE